jgi:CIC family chloride channel protein
MKDAEPHSGNSAVPFAGHEDKLMLAWTLVTAGIVGAVTVGFMVSTEHLAAWLHPEGDSAAWRRLVFPILGAALAGLLLRRFFPDSAGSGIPQTKAALILNDGQIPFRTAIGKFICSTITLASGVSLGREGPSVQVGAGIASALGRRIGLDRHRIRALVPAGAAAAVSAAFNTPIAAVLFTLEELVGNLHAPLLGPVVLSAATSWLVMRALLGDAPLFHVPAYQLVHPVEFLFYGLLGAAGGLVSAGFVKLLLRIRSWFATFPARTKAIQPAAGGLFVGVLAFFVPEVLGVGYPIVDQALNGKLVFQSMAILLCLKIAATALCYSSGNAGGIFGPSLFIGAMLGGAIGSGASYFMPDSTGSVGAYALAGMGAAFAGIVRAPLTSVIMIFEITRDYSIIVPLMISNLLSFFVSQRLQPEPVYEALLLQDRIHLPPARSESMPRTIRDAVQPRGDRTGTDGIHYPEQPLDAALETFASLPQDAVISVRSRLDEENEIGILTRGGVLAAFAVPEPVPAPGQGKALLTGLAVGLIVLIGAVSLAGYLSRRDRRTAAEAQYQEALSLSRAGRNSEAIELLRGAVAVLRGEEQRLVLARTLVSAGRHSEAEGFLRELLASNPALGPANLWMARVQSESGNLDRARDHFNRAIYGDWPDFAVTDRREARWELAAILHQLGIRDAAVAELSQIADASRDSTDWSLRVAQRYFSWGEFSRAANLFRSLKDTPGLARSLFASARYHEALPLLEQAARQFPERADLAREFQLATAITSADPRAPRLSRSVRLKRARDLLASVRTSLRACGLPPLATTTPTSVADLFEEAQQLWNSRAASCSPAGDTQVLSLLLAPTAP